jgi:hypothetical protein
MAKTKHGLQETTGLYQIRGIVTGVDKDKFYTEKKTKSQKDMRMVNFGVEIEPNKSIYLSLNGMVKDEVCFSKSEGEGKDRKTTVEKVKWDKRNSFNKEGFGLLGLRLGLEKDEDGKNIQETLVEFDACKKISETLKDGASLFSKGKIEFSSFDSTEGKKRSIKFVPQQMSLCSKDIDFADEEFEVKSDFSQQIIFMGIEKKEDVFVVSAKIVTYSSIEDAEFIIKDKNLAQMFKQKLKPYNAIQVHGHIEVIENVETVVDDDTWGESDPTQRINNPTRRDLVVTGAKGSSVDTTTYSKDKIEEAVKKLEQSETAQGDWGSSNNVQDVDDGEW